MSKSNPKKAIAALIPQPIKTSAGDVMPLTLATYALLEAINSPMLRGDKTCCLELLPTLYILTHSARDIMTRWDTLSADAMDWADQYPPNIIGEIETAAATQIAVMLDVMAGMTNDKKKGTSATTDG